MRRLGNRLRSSNRRRCLDEMPNSLAKVVASMRRPVSSGILPIRSKVRRSAALSLSAAFNSVPGDLDTDPFEICDSASIFLQVASTVTLSSSTSLAVVAGRTQDQSKGCGTSIIVSSFGYDEAKGPKPMIDSNYLVKQLADDLATPESGRKVSS